MVRNRKRKSNIGQHTEQEIIEGINLILGGEKIRETARRISVPYTTLQRYYKKYIKNEDNNMRFTPNYDNRKIFSNSQEESLVDYIVKCSQMFYGLTPIDVRKLAYEMAEKNNIIVPKKWKETQLAGVEWLYSFRKRHPILSLRTPEGCSLSRATSFNRHNVELFFNNLEEVMRREPKFGNGTRVFNLDETNTMTVQKSAKVLAVRGQKQVSKITSAEKGTLVTTCYIVNALGQALSPVMIFPRVNFKEHMKAGAPTGTLGLATPSGWMNSALFVRTMQHFIDFSQSSKENPSLLIMDNYEAHICIEALNLAKENGVTILTVPPHSTGKLQPLDVGLFKPFKVAYNAAVDSWLMRNPGKTFSIYEVADCVRQAHMKAMTPENICSSFESTGIYPFNREIFTDLDFVPSEVTDREIPLDNFSVPSRDSQTPSPSILMLQNQQLRTPSPLLEEQISSVSALQSKTALSSKMSPLGNNPGTSKEFVSPFQFKGLPKAGARKNTRAPRRKGKSMIATDTPNKIEAENRAAEKKRKKSAIGKKRKVLQETYEENEAGTCQNKKKKQLAKKKNTQYSSESSEEDNISVYSEEEGAYEDENEEEEGANKDVTDNFGLLQSQPKEGDYVLVQFVAGKKKVYYLAKIIGEGTANNAEVSYLRKSTKIKNGFLLPNVPDIATVDKGDIKMILPKPIVTAGTKRQQGVYKFDLDFSGIDLR